MALLWEGPLSDLSGPWRVLRSRRLQRLRLRDMAVFFDSGGMASLTRGRGESANGVFKSGFPDGWPCLPQPRHHERERRGRSSSGPCGVCTQLAAAPGDGGAPKYRL